MANALIKVRKSLIENSNTEVSISDIRIKCDDLLDSEISMALCHLKKQRWVTRVKGKSRQAMGRKEIWLYTYHQKRQPA
jgi:predicted transcriptional regulator